MRMKKAGQKSFEKLVVACFGYEFLSIVMRTVYQQIEEKNPLVNAINRAKIAKTQLI